LVEELIGGKSKVYRLKSKVESHGQAYAGSSLKAKVKERAE
jgi:hypothetical protein